MYDKFKDYPLMNDRKGSVPLFYPHIPKSAIKSLKKVLSGRWIGQGPLVDLLKKISKNLQIITLVCCRS